MANFSGQLRSNEIFSALYNMIISQQVFADNMADNYTLVDKAKTDGSMFGDTKLYYATDCLKSAPWGNDAEALNLLALHRPAAPDVQAISLDKFRQISLTVDNYLSKRAWADEGTFSSFNSVMQGWISDTKRIYDKTLYNTFIGTTETSIGAQQQTVDIDEGGRTLGENVARKVADILTEMQDVSRDFNDYGNLRSYSLGDIKIVWNSKYLNEVKKIDLPSIFHSDMLVSTFEGDVLPKRYFGTVGNSAIAKASNDGTKRSTIEADYAAAAGTAVTHVFPADLIPSGTALVTSLNENGTAKTISAGIAAGDYYTPSEDVVCKIFVKLPPYMSAFEVGTSFFNPKSLTENHYLTFGHNTLEYLKNYPLVTVKAV